MPVASSQIAELLEVFLKYLPKERIQELLTDLKSTQAYFRNQSFRMTIDSLKLALSEG